MIVVDEAAARLVADAYDASASRRDRLVEASYAQLAVECDRLFREMTAPDRPGAVRVRFTTCRAPYAAAGELIDAVRTTRLLEVVTVAADPDRRHPLVDSTAGGAYDRFRAVHDVLGHARPGLGFDRNDEFAAWRAQHPLHSPLARWALATELHGQHSVLWTTGRLAEPKAILLEPWILRRSVAGSLGTRTPDRARTARP